MNRYESMGIFYRKGSSWKLIKKSGIRDWVKLQNVEELNRGAIDKTDQTVSWFWKNIEATLRSQWTWNDTYKHFSGTNINNIRPVGDN